MRKALFALAVLLMPLSAAEAQEGYKVVVNPANPVASLSKTQLSKLFLDQANWDDGAPVSAIDLVPGSRVRDVFSKDVYGLPVTGAIERMRTARTATGAALIPAVPTETDVVAYVRTKRGAVGYVSLAADVQGLKVVAVGRGTDEPSGAPLEVGAAITAPQRVTHVQPVYPETARQGRVEGTVSISVVIGPTGKVETATVVRSIPGLNDAALSAVKQWQYRPTLVNGVAVPVSMVVHVNFAL